MRLRFNILNKTKSDKDIFLEKNMRINKKISESKKKIEEEKEKIKKNKQRKFNNSRIGRFFSKIGSFFKRSKNSYTFTSVLFVSVCSFLIGGLVCFSIFMIMFNKKNYFLLSKELDKFVSAYETIVNNYYDDIDKKKLIDNAIDGMIAGVGDAYTSYVDSESASAFDELVNGKYEGIGCKIQMKESGIVVVSVFDGSPSEKAGLLQGDIILSVNDISVNGMTADGLSNYIRNQSDSKIKMVVLRDGEEKEIELIREIVETPVVNSDVYYKNDKKVGYLGISIFSSVAYKQFSDKLEELEKDGIDSLIIDVRDNNGGYLSTVTDILNDLLSKGDVMYQIEKDNKKSVTKDKTVDSKDYPIAVLTNGGSASASEILAGAIKESYNGYVVGTTTYGKGTVQQTKKLSDGSMIKYTVENWLTPDGNWIDGKGIEPTHIIKLDDSYYKNPITENDNQLQKALELVSQ